MQKRNGFTLVEVLVVIAVLGILTSISIGFSRTNAKQLAVFTERAAFVSAILRTKSLAIQTYVFPPGAAVPCGFGIHVTNTGYTIFKDSPPGSGGTTGCPGTPNAAPFYGAYAVPPPPVGLSQPSQADETFSPHDLDPRLILDLCYRPSASGASVACYSSVPSLAEFEIMFVPPEPKIYFAQAVPVPLFNPAVSEAIFRFYYRDAPPAVGVPWVAEVVVNRAGQVSVN